MEIVDNFTLAEYFLRMIERESEYKCAEIYIEQNEYKNIDIEENSIKYSEVGFDQGASIRIYSKKGSIGFAFTNNLSKKSLEKIIKTAFKMMRLSSVDTDFNDLPNYSLQYPSILNLHDKEIENLSIEESIRFAKDLIDECKNNKSIMSQSGGFTAYNISNLVFNTNGVESFSKETVCSITSDIVIKDDKTGELTNGYEYQIERNLKDINSVNVVNEAIRTAEQNLNRIKIKSKNLPIVLSPKATISLILRPIGAAINAETFQYKRSFLINKRNKKLGTEYLNIEDNALIDGAVGSSIFDGEGVPCRNKKIFDSGLFLESGLLHNSYTAGKEGVESTGNAYRPSYTSLPSIGISNLILKPGKCKKEEIIQEIKEGIYLDHTGDSPNIATGDFSGLISKGNLILNGEIVDPLNETMFGINILDMFKNLNAISEDFKVYGHYHAPYVKIENVKIIGSQTKQ